MVDATAWKPKELGDRIKAHSWGGRQSQPWVRGGQFHKLVFLPDSWAAPPARLNFEILVVVDEPLFFHCFEALFVSVSMLIRLQPLQPKNANDMRKAHLKDKISFPLITFKVSYLGPKRTLSSLLFPSLQRSSMASTNRPIGSRSRYVCSSLKVLLKDSVPWLLLTP